MSSDESDSDLPRLQGCDACRKKKTKCYSAKMRDYCCTNCRAPMGRPRSTIGSYDAVSWDPLLWKKWRGPCAGAPDLVFLPQLPEVCPLDELAWNVARERYHKQWDAAHLVSKKAEKEFKAWEQEQWKPRADGMSVVYFRPADPSKCDRYMPHALKIPDGDSNLSYRWIDLHTLTGPEVTKIFEDNAVTDELNDRQEQWETTQFPISYVQMVILRNLPPRMEIWRPNCRNYPLGRIMESLTEEERHRALTLCLEVAITAARELIQPKKLSDALMKRCRGDLRKLKEDVGCHRYPTAKRIITTLLTVYHLSRTPHEAERAVTWYDKMAAVSTSCVYYADIDRGETDECRCYCQFKRLRRECSYLDINGLGVRRMIRKIGSLHETQSDFMQILISQFAKSQEEIHSLMVLQRIEADGSSTVGIVSVTARLETLPTVIGCLEVMESVSKVIPGFGGIVEGACGTLRKILSTAESANACRSECIALAEHTTLITCAIFNEVAASPSLAGSESVGDLLLALQNVKKSISRLQNISRVKYFVMQSHIKNELQRLRDSVSDACLAFGIRSDLSARQILQDLKTMQTTLLSRVEEIRISQMRNHDEITRKQDLMQRQLEQILAGGMLR